MKLEKEETFKITYFAKNMVRQLLEMENGQTTARSGYLKQVTNFLLTMI